MDNEFEKTPHSIAKRHAVKVLQELLEREPVLTKKLMDIEFPIGDWIIQHPTLVPGGTIKNPTLGIIGLLNGLFCYSTDGIEDAERIAKYIDFKHGGLTGFGVVDIPKVTYSFDIASPEGDRSVFSLYIDGQCVMSDDLYYFNQEFNNYANSQFGLFKLNTDDKVLRHFGYKEGDYFNVRMIAGVKVLFPVDPKENDIGIKYENFKSLFTEETGVMINTISYEYQLTYSEHKEEKYRLIKLIDDCPEYHVGDLFKTASIGGDIWLHKDPPEVGMSVLPIELLHHFEKVEL